MVAFIAYYCDFNDLTNKFKSWREEKVEVNYSFVFLKFRFIPVPLPARWWVTGRRASESSERWSVNTYRTVHPHIHTFPFVCIFGSH